MCDHKWGDGPDEYSKCRTVLQFTEEGGKQFNLLRCDMCKKFIIESVGMKLEPEERTC